MTIFTIEQQADMEADKIESLGVCGDAADFFNRNRNMIYDALRVYAAFQRGDVIWNEEKEQEMHDAAIDAYRRSGDTENNEDLPF